MDSKPVFLLRSNEDGTANVVAADGSPLTLTDDGSGDAPFPVVVNLNGWRQDTPPVSPSGESPMTEEQYKAALATSPAGAKVLGDPGAYARHLADARARGLV